MILTHEQERFLEANGFTVEKSIKLTHEDGKTFISRRIEKGNLTLNLFENCKAEINKEGRMLTIEGQGHWTCYIHNTGYHSFNLH